jgi:hypothetical protein
MPSFYAFTQAAITLPASVYGLGEVACGDVDAPRPCIKGATTASGETFDPQALTAAVFLPARFRARPHYVHVRVPPKRDGEPGGPCVRLWVNDKGNARFTGQRGLDVTPAAFKALTGTPARPHSQIPELEDCKAEVSP